MAAALSVPSIQRLSAEPRAPFAGFPCIAWRKARLLGFVFYINRVVHFCCPFLNLSTRFISFSSPCVWRTGRTGRTGRAGRVGSGRRTVTEDTPLSGVQPRAYHVFATSSSGWSHPLPLSDLSAHSRPKAYLHTACTSSGQSLHFRVNAMPAPSCRSCAAPPRNARAHGRPSVSGTASALGWRTRLEAA